MREPAVGGRTVPVHYIGGDFHHIARPQFAGRFARSLIVAAAAHSDQHLSARVAVPVVAAPRLERHVGNRAVELPVPRQPGEVCLPGEILRKHFGQFFPARENNAHPFIRFHITLVFVLCINTRRREQQHDERHNQPAFHFPEFFHIAKVGHFKHPVLTRITVRRTIITDSPAGARQGSKKTLTL